MFSFSTSSVPRSGHARGRPAATAGSSSCALSRGKSVYSTTRSTAFILVSSSVAMLVPCSRYLVTSSAYTRHRPAMPALTLPWITRNAAQPTIAVPKNRRRVLSHPVASFCVTNASALCRMRRSAMPMKCDSWRNARMVSTPATASPRPL